jgi:hypothetical protein
MEKAFIYSISDYFNVADIAPADRLLKYANDVNELVYIPYGEDDNAGVIYGLALIGVGYYNENEPSENYPSLLKAGIFIYLLII